MAPDSNAAAPTDATLGRGGERSGLEKCAQAQGHSGLHAEAGQGAGADRVLGPASLVALGLGGLIGAGVFVTVGMAAHDKAGPAVVLSFLVAAVACIAVALCYCECASRLPVAGSAYAYGRASIGAFGGWITGWNLATCYLLAGAAVSQGWSGYFQSLLGAFGLSWPKSLSAAPFDIDPSAGQFATTGSLLNLPALLALAAVTFIAYRGIRVSLRVNLLLLLLKLSVLAIVIVVGLAHTDVRNWTPFAPFGYGGLSLKNLLGPLGGQSALASTGMLAGATTVFFAFGGFEMLSAYSHECHAPRRDVPIGVIATICLLTLLYIGVAAAVIGMVPYDRISVSAPISEAFRAAGMPWAQRLVAFGAVAGMSSVLLVVVMSLPRVLIAIGQDGLLPERVFNTIHPIYRTPATSVLLVGLAAMLLGALLPLRFLMDAVMMATLASYVAVCAFVLILRRRRSAPEPVFRAPLGPVVPAFGIAVCLMLMFSLPPINWVWLGGWWAVGLLVYLAYGRKASARVRESRGLAVVEEASVRPSL
ncbi:MAG TPA: amino acid permease [Chthonomonadaceae bacterium]|nr:amino acid permease [Chthonomonadaceae bacterium]